MEILAYAAMTIMGVIIGLIGGGGGILTVPILVFWFGLDPVSATAYSLAIVGASAFAGTLLKAHSGLVDWKTGIVFGIPSIIVTLLTRRFLVPAIPDHVGVIEKGSLLLLVFGLVMLAAGCFMVCKKRRSEYSGIPNIPPGWKRRTLTIWQGSIVGLVAGLVGAGGWFLIVPALILFENATVARAVATSLFIIALNSIFGLLGDFANPGFHMDFHLLGTALAFALVGLGVWVWLHGRIPGDRLSRSFGIFTMVAAIAIFAKELYL